MQAHTRRKIAFYLFYAGLVLLVASLPLSKFMMSVSQFMIALGWLLDGEFREKLKRFFSSRLALVLVSLYLMHVAGLIFTTEFDYAWKDLRIKLPLLILPFMLVSAPRINRLQFEGILFALIGGVTVSTFISWLIYVGVIDRQVSDIRDICIFISHIRLALLCCLSIFSITWLVWRYRNDNKARFYYPLLLLIPWLVYFMFLIESITGLSILIIGTVILANAFIYTQGGIPTRLVIVLISLAIPVSIYFYFGSVHEKFSVTEKVDYSKLEKFTPSGNPYDHFTDRKQQENGYYVWLYLSEKELEQEWNKRSSISYQGIDLRKQQIKFTLMRFLTSRGLHKDSAGMASLSESEIRSIENGIANAEYQGKGSIGMRIHQVLWELYQYRNNADPSGHSVAQRLEFWKAAVLIIRQNPIVGVGTGDVQEEFIYQYIKMKSKLSQEWRLRSHNQYLSIAVAFGLLGLAWFLFTLIYPLVTQIRKKDFLYISFSIISMISMVTEDTLETQAGVTFFALFTSVFLFINPHNSNTDGI